MVHTSEQVWYYVDSTIDGDSCRYVAGTNSFFYIIGVGDFRYGYFSWQIVRFKHSFEVSNAF